jgi:hypothetical protein
MELKPLIRTAMQRVVRKAKQMQRTIGVRYAAGYLRNRAVTFEDAHLVLFGRLPRA